MRLFHLLAACALGLAATAAASAAAAAAAACAAGAGAARGRRPARSRRRRRGLPRSTPPAAGPPAGRPGDRRPRPSRSRSARCSTSVRRHYPLLLAIERERGVAAGRLTAAMGAFDTNIDMSRQRPRPRAPTKTIAPTSASRSCCKTAAFRCLAATGPASATSPPTTSARRRPMRARFAAGSRCRWPATATSTRPGPAATRPASTGRIAEPTIVRSRLDYMRAAALAYWNWLGSGEREVAAERLEQLAVRRDGEIAARVDRGVMANIERVDNQKNIALRRGLLVQADRGGAAVDDRPLAVSCESLRASRCWPPAGGCSRCPSRARRA